ncbi:uncharacterized protein LOC120067541 [Benincasa hispida]|uniref:uncharacterized protein LOC120067541 n=1 Tax=Benincasa hispida TaxID=102211 RepID=UPI0019012E05|nr:uncharacterized protein LOC120067541 [Benincasa hispida]
MTDQTDEQAVLSSSTGNVNQGKKADVPVSSKSGSNSEPSPIVLNKIPYPQNFQKKKLNDQLVKFLDIFKKLHINILFANALEHMPNYVKSMKYKTVSLNEECNAILQKKLLQKLKDPGNFIPQTRHRRGTADDDLIAVGRLFPTYPRGVVEDVLVKVGDFIFLANLVVLDMEEAKIPIILGRPFLATSRDLIEVYDGKVILRVNDEECGRKLYISGAIVHGMMKPP